MRLLRFADGGRARLGALVRDRVVALDAIAPHFVRMRDIVAADPDELRTLGVAIDAAEPTLQLERLDLLAPIERPGKFLAIGMNYGAHLAEAKKLGIEARAHQLWFNKQTTCIAGPYDDIEPGVTDKLDYEVELCVVIGRTAKGIARAEAAAHVFGYMIVNDVSARDWQFHSTTMTMGKSFDTHGPIGPWIVTADEVPDPHDLGLRCLVNGELRQNSSTSKMLADVWSQIEYLSTAFTLEPGDLLATGTPEGVGMGMEPPRFLRSGDIVRCEIERIGAIENRVGARAP